MDFPLGSLLDASKCHEFLVSVLHPQGLRCPNGHGMDQAYVHHRQRPTVPCYGCRSCGRYFNLFTGTLFQGTKHDVVGVVQILRGVVQGVTTSRLAREMGVSYKWLLAWRHKVQALAAGLRPTDPLIDKTVEADEMYQNAGEKRRKARRPGRSAASARQQGAGSRDLRAGSPAGVRTHRT